MYLFMSQLWQSYLPCLYKKNFHYLFALFSTHKISTWHEMRHSYSYCTRFEQRCMKRCYFIILYDAMVCGEEMNTLVQGRIVFFQIHVCTLFYTQNFNVA